MKQKRSVSSIPSWIWSRVREIGPLYAAQRALLHVFPRRWFEVNMWIFMENNLAEWHSAQITDDEVRWATVEDFDLLAQFGDSFEIRSNLDLGYKVAVFIRDGRVCGWTWYATEYADQHDWLRVLMDKDECCAVFSLVDSACRRQGIARRIGVFARSDFARLGYRRLGALVDALNQPSLQAYNMDETIGRIFYIRFLGLTFVRIGQFMRIGRWGQDRRLEIHTRLIASGGRN